MTHYFDYEKIAKQAGISSDPLNALREQIQKDYPQDSMMYELRLLRICLAIRDGHCTLEEGLKPELETALLQHK